MLHFLQQPFDKQNYRQLFDKWAAGQGAAHLFVYYQKPYRVTEQGDIEVSERQPHEFIVTDGKSALHFHFSSVLTKISRFFSYGTGFDEIQIESTWLKFAHIRAIFDSRQDLNFKELSSNLT